MDIIVKNHEFDKRPYYRLSGSLRLSPWQSDDMIMEDTAGNFETRYYSVRKIHKEHVLKSYKRMLLAILPFDAIGTEECNYQYQRYFYNTLLKSFKDNGRFNIIEEKLKNSITPFPNVMEISSTKRVKSSMWIWAWIRRSYPA